MDGVEGLAWTVAAADSARCLPWHLASRADVAQIHRSSGPAPADPPVPVSFLPRVKSGSLYPKLADIPFSSPVSALWRAFGKPPSSTCTTSAGLVCNWTTAIDEVHVEGLGNESFGAIQGGAVAFNRVVISTSDLSRSKLRGWATPDGIRLGSTAAEVKRIADPLQCGSRSCDIQPRQRLHAVGNARYRFSSASSSTADRHMPHRA